MIEKLTDQALLESLLNNGHHLARVHVVEKLTNRALLRQLLEKPEHAEVIQAIQNRLMMLNDEFKCCLCGFFYPKNQKTAGYAINLCSACTGDLKPYQGGHLVFSNSDGRDICHTCVKCGNSECISGGIPVGDMLYKTPCKTR